MNFKLNYYAFWKQMRSVLDSLKKGREPRIPAHCSYPDEASRVIAYMQTLPPERLHEKNIIDIRRAYFEVSKL